MKPIHNLFKVTIVTMAMMVTATSCHDLLDEPAENRTFTGDTDYSNVEEMILPLLGAYGDVQDRGWEDYPVISVRGDDVNAGGLGDQQDLAEADLYNYNKDYWMFNSVWQNLYNDIFKTHSAMEQIEMFKANIDNTALADQYIAEAKTLRAFLLFNISRVWGDVFIPTNSNPLDLTLTTAKLESRETVMQHISDQMDEAIPLLPAMHPRERTDIRGGVTRYTALAIKALANLELKNYQAVADATSAIISSGEFALEPDFYNLFKLNGKLNTENVFEFQYSDFGLPSGDNEAFPYAFFGPQGWGPRVKGAGDGWGFWEPSMKYIKFMLKRNEETRLKTTVLFTQRGIDEIKKDVNHTTLPAWVSHITPSGDTIKNYSRAMFASGKHYLPSELLTAGRTDYGTNKNMTVIRYAEILLMHAEALKQGATSSAMTADDAVNLVRQRAGLDDLANVTLEQVMEEKYAELATEWGSRYYDMVRLGRYEELSYDGRTFTESKVFLPYPQGQVDIIPALREIQ